MSATTTPVSDPRADSPIPHLGAPTGPGEVESTEPAGPPDPSRQHRRPVTRGIDRFNRVMFTLLGLILLGAGVVALLAGNGVFGTDSANRPTLTPGNRAFAASHAWFWPVVGVATAAIVLLALIWLSAQFSSGRLSALHVMDDRFGRVRVDGRAFTAAVRNELAGTDGVRQVHARLLGSEEHPLLQVVVTVQPDADIHRIRSEIEQIALPHARETAARPNLTVELELVPGAHRSDRVR
ncbi:alkaline shock response membrane anchor protein AmaP [Protofrankia symbiont of Coriaria ruscifolia]|uniref:alkaline shock response membrane anchor protein AmaP n=1 Tax=Protofrankia symbiont of Coriaria ruscifolia TaxID=1306542 RepID=UPI0010416F61|nr:alkaline shock response membrane anchor protein AmaP [Protofrankia symbiont of Coriaria ruscifolia]